MSKNFLKMVNLLEKIVTGATAATMMFLSIIVTYQVFGRYVLNNSPFWIEEISVTVLMWVGLLGASGCIWDGSHMGLGLFVEKLPRKIQVWIRFLVDIILASFSWFLLVEGIFLVKQTMSGTLATLSIPLGYTYLILPISAAIMVFFSVVKAINRVMVYYKGNEEAGAND